jgi:hypothetical protein
MNIVLSHVVNSAILGPRFIGNKLFGGSFNGSRSVEELQVGTDFCCGWGILSHMQVMFAYDG